MNKYEFQKLLEKLTGLQMQSGFNSANKDEYLKYLHVHFSERDILILKEGKAIPPDYKRSDYIG